mgnify:CR=1 FL=1
MKIFHSLEEVVTPGGQPGALGAGSFAKVALVAHKNDPSRLYAMKELEKHSLRATQLIQKEVKLHMTLNHPHIIKFEDYIETPKKVYIFLEFAKHGDMYNHINKNRPNDDECLRFFYQTCEGIAYLHAKNIMHRDLKPENILLDQNLNVKIADFGWSAEYLPTECRQTLCGTYEYMAPEIFFRKQQTKKTDIWALGILLYELFHGHAPFRGAKMEEVLANIMKNTLGFKKGIDPSIRNLITKILNFEPTSRPTIEEILASEPVVNYLRRNPHQRVKQAESSYQHVTINQPSSQQAPLSSRSVSAARIEPARNPKAITIKLDKENTISTGLVKQSSQEENSIPKNQLVIKSRSINQGSRPVSGLETVQKIYLSPPTQTFTKTEESTSNLVSHFTKLDINGKQMYNLSFAQFLNSNI